MADRSKPTTWLLAILLFALAATLPAQEGSAVLREAAGFMAKRQFKDALRVLDTKGAALTGQDAARARYMRGDCHYRQGQYQPAREAFSQALQQLKKPEEQALAAYRLAFIAYRLGEADEAIRRIDAFARSYPKDSHLGKLLVIKMSFLRERGKDAQPELEALHRQIQDGIKRFGPQTAVEADSMLSEYYRLQGQADKAIDIFHQVVTRYRAVIMEAQSAGRDVPADLARYYDNANLQLGLLHLQKRQYREAVRYLENVRFDRGTTAKARLLLAKTFYNENRFDQAVDRLTRGGYLERVPAGALKSEMHLVLGLSERYRKKGDPARAIGWLEQVGTKTRDYGKAQLALAELYEGAKRTEDAIRTYQRVLEISPSMAPEALFKVGTLCCGIGLAQRDTAVGKDYLDRSVKSLQRLLALYPLSPQATAARDFIGQHKEAGIYPEDLTITQEERRKHWQHVAETQPGTLAAAQALAELARDCARHVVEDQTGKALQLPDWNACAKACDRLLDERVYTGRDLAAASWRAMRAEACYYRGMSELASAFPDRTDPRRVYLPSADVPTAIGFFRRARQLMDPKNLELVKLVELGLLESLFKSSDKKDRKEAVRRFASLEADYGQDPRFQRLALGLADWYREQGRTLEAAEAYAGIASRAHALDQDDVLKAWFMAGGLYAKAAKEALVETDRVAVGIRIMLKGEVALAEPDLLATYPPLLAKVNPGFTRGRHLRAHEALVMLAEATNVSFVWSPQRGSHSVHDYLHGRTVEGLPAGELPAAEFLRRILDLEHHRLVFDTGITGGEGILPPPDPDDPHADKVPQQIEIYDRRRAAERSPMLARPYGKWTAVQPGRSKPILYNALQAVEKACGVKADWASGLDRERLLATEFDLPREVKSARLSCGALLKRVLDVMGLEFTVVPRDYAGELFERSTACFNKICLVNRKGRYGEKAMFAAALNYYHRKQYDRMQAILREYLKIFDYADYEFYRQACFWMGWCLEHQEKYRDAASYYARATEERLVLRPRAEGEPAPTVADLEALMSYDTRFALGVPLVIAFADADVARFAQVLGVNFHLDVELAEGAGAAAEPWTLERAKLTGMELLRRGAERYRLAVGVENVDPEYAEKGYYRMARCYRQENLMREALENISLLLERYPVCRRRREALALQLEIYQGLKDYRQVLATLDLLKLEAAGDIARYRFDYKMGQIRFDLCDYGGAVTDFHVALRGAEHPAEVHSIRNALARAYYRDGNLDLALAHYRQLISGHDEVYAKNDPRRLQDRLMVHLLRNLTGHPDVKPELPEDALKYIHAYEALPDERRDSLPRADLVRINFIYYVSGLLDLHRQKLDDARRKLMSASNSPDDELAGEAGFRAALVDYERGRFAEAKEACEVVLFATDGTETDLRANYLLGRCLDELGRPEAARKYYRMLEARYPISPLVEHLKKEGKLAEPAEPAEQQEVSP